MQGQFAIVAQSSGEEAGGAAFFVIYLAVIVLLVVSMWKVFAKANQPGWGVLIPIYNIILMLKIANKPVWWIILLIVPIANIVVSVLVALAIAKNFGKGAGFGLGLAFLPVIFYPILGFGDAEYSPVGPAA